MDGDDRSARKSTPIFGSSGGCYASTGGRRRHQGERCLGQALASSLVAGWVCQKLHCLGLVRGAQLTASWTSSCRAGPEPPFRLPWRESEAGASGLSSDHVIASGAPVTSPRAFGLSRDQEELGGPCDPADASQHELGAAWSNFLEHKN